MDRTFTNEKIKNRFNDMTKFIAKVFNAAHFPVCSKLNIFEKIYSKINDKNAVLN
jgi:hypothetical protein